MSKFVWKIQVRDRVKRTYSRRGWHTSLSLPGRYYREDHAQDAIDTYSLAYPDAVKSLEYRPKQKKAKKVKKHPEDSTYAAEYRSRNNASVTSNGWRPESGSAYSDYSKLEYDEARKWFAKRLIYSEKRLVRSDGKVINEESK